MSEATRRTIELIKSSPLKYIIGDCRLSPLTPDEWGTLNIGASDVFFAEYDSEARTITFAHEQKLLGGIVIEKGDISNCELDEFENLTLEFEIRHGDETAYIRIECKANFPGMMEFGRFVAYMPMK